MLKAVILLKYFFNVNQGYNRGAVCVISEQVCKLYTPLK